MKIHFRFIVTFIVALSHVQWISGQSLSRDMQVSILTNQVGYTAKAGKTCMVTGNVAQSFKIIEISTNKTVFEGTFKNRPGDFGDYLVGDFSRFAQTGRFYITADSLRSYPFLIRPDVYHPAIDLVVHYFALQRCGASSTGYLSPCHIDDGMRLDNGKHQDVTGGWHDASDLRKWVSATIYGMLGLAKAYDFQKAEAKKAEILEELMWGNAYFQKMQEPQGYVMDFIGGEIEQGGDNNRWTDNVIGKEGGEMHLVKPGTGKSGNRMMIFGAQDDRIIQTKPVDRISQYNFISAEASMARFTKTKDKTYSDKCLAAAEKCFEWCLNEKKDLSPLELGGSILAALELYKVNKSDKYKQFAVEQAKLLKTLQAENAADNEVPGGFFYASSKSKEPFKNIWQGCMDLISLCDLVETFPAHSDVSIWKEMIGKYSHNYLTAMAKRNSFDLIPFGLYAANDAPEGGRKIGEYWYRYFMVPKDWWVGINANIAASGIGMLKASRIMNDANLKLLAQRQLDWIMGTNPFDSSTIVGVGYNQPKPFINGGEFRPETPLLPGAVMNGLGGDTQDNPSIGTGNYNISEYWTPMVAYTLWLMTESSTEKSN